MVDCPQTKQPCTKNMCGMWIENNCRLLIAEKEDSAVIAENTSLKAKVDLRYMKLAIPNTSTDKLYELYENFDDVYKILQKELFERI